MEFMRPLINDMVQDDPEKQPTIDEEVSERSVQLFRQLSSRTLRGRLVDREETVLERAIFGVTHVFRTVKYIAKRLPAVPVPSE